MKKINIFGIVSLVILVVILMVIRLVPKEIHYRTVKISNTNIRAEVADTSLKRMEGMMSKQSLPYGQGMLFEFDKEGYPEIWMMNMKFPIDILWINKDFKIVHIVENAQPCVINCQTYIPDKKALYVIEVNAGFVKKNRIELGDTIKII